MLRRGRRWAQRWLALGVAVAAAGVLSGCNPLPSSRGAAATEGLLSLPETPFADAPAAAVVERLAARLARVQRLGGAYEHRGQIPAAGIEFFDREYQYRAWVGYVREEFEGHFLLSGSRWRLDRWETRRPEIHAQQRPGGRAETESDAEWRDFSIACDGEAVRFLGARTRAMLVVAPDEAPEVSEPSFFVAWREREALAGWLMGFPLSGLADLDRLTVVEEWNDPTHGHLLRLEGTGTREVFGRKNREVELVVARDHEDIVLHYRQTSDGHLGVRSEERWEVKTYGEVTDNIVLPSTIVQTHIAHTPDGPVTTGEVTARFTEFYTPNLVRLPDGQFTLQARLGALVDDRILGRKYPVR